MLHLPKLQAHSRFGFPSGRRDTAVKKCGIGAERHSISLG
jgi:hypothetical protein